MQVGWTEPGTGREESFAYWLEQAERNGSALGYPYEVLLGIATQLEGKDRPDGFTVTMLSKCARAVFIDGTAEHYADPSANYAAFRGVIGHSMLEKNQHPGAIVERRMYRMYRDEPLSGQLDKMRLRVPGFTTAQERDLLVQWLDWCDQMFMFEQAGENLDPDALWPVAPALPEGATLEIQDWKTKHEVPFGSYVYSHHQQQGNIYRWLLRVPTDRVRIEFVYVSMTETKTLQVYNGGKFANGRARPVQIMTDDEVEGLLDSRLAVLVRQRNVSRPLPYDKVPVADLWECKYCPVRELCYSRAADEARTAFEAGKPYGRITPRSQEDEQKVRLPGSKKTKKEAV